MEAAIPATAAHHDHNHFSPIRAIPLVALAVAGCATVYAAAEFDDRTTVHETVAILPFDGSIDLRETFHGRHWSPRCGWMSDKMQHVCMFAARRQEPKIMLNFRPLLIALAGLVLSALSGFAAADVSVPDADALDAVLDLVEGGGRRNEAFRGELYRQFWAAESQ